MTGISRLQILARLGVEQGAYVAALRTQKLRIIRVVALAIYTIFPKLIE
ncbi:hypothetical protein AWB64_00400 [Caballeronia sordidicola]|jgi:hypothetical protein|uniref:Uncharacterized protein n=1 Tax=Caballeronia sordidicola TaxID=196367 RepID=A0A158EVA4_CABSO|nr:hypothetical protein AWB64_00400 [Caballeronia sordidicola]